MKLPTLPQLLVSGAFLRFLYQPTWPAALVVFVTIAFVGVSLWFDTAREYRLHLEKLVGRVNELTVDVTAVKDRFKSIDAAASLRANLTGRNG